MPDTTLSKSDRTGVERIETHRANLITVDNQSIPLPLTREEIASKFAIEERSGHRQLALGCLQYLIKEIGDPQSRESLAFTNYACNYLFEHLNHVELDSEILVALSRFLGSQTVLSWLLYLANSYSLVPVYQAGKTIENLLSWQPQQALSPRFDNQLSLLKRWGNDFLHVVPKFGRQLSRYPSSIRDIIPPFCPFDSPLRQQFSSLGRGLSVHGLSATTWGDCLTVINFSGLVQQFLVRPNAVATWDGGFALGMLDGQIIVYDDDITCQESRRLDHEESVRCLAVGKFKQYLASSGRTLVHIWSLKSWSKLFSISIPQRCMALNFTKQDNFLLGAIINNRLMCWDMNDDGSLVRTDEYKEPPFPWPVSASFSPYQNIVAIVYHYCLLILEFDNGYYEGSGSCFRRLTLSEDTLVKLSMAFGLAIDIAVLAVADESGCLVVYDIHSCTVRGTLAALNAGSLCCSPDGRTLATTDSIGNIRLFDLASLKSIYSYCTPSYEMAYKALAFTSDGRIIDVRQNRCRIIDVRRRHQYRTWDPAADRPEITAILCVQSVPIVFCGKDDGSVHAYDISSESESHQQLFPYRERSTIRHLDFRRGVLVCSDTAGRVTCGRVIRDKSGRWKIYNLQVITLTWTIKNVLTSGEHLLVSTESNDTLFRIPEPTVIQTAIPTEVARLEIEEEKGWVSCSTDQLALVTTEPNVKIYSWDSLEYIRSISTCPDPRFKAIERIIPSTRFFATLLKDPSRLLPPSSLIQIWDIENIMMSDSTFASPVYTIQSFSCSIPSSINIIGFLRDRLVFLSFNNWIYSTKVNSVNQSLERHFFIPDDFISAMDTLLLSIGPNGEIVVVQRDKLVVIKHGLLSHWGQ